MNETTFLQALRWVALAAVLVVCAVAEYHGAATAGLHPAVAACLPLAVDSFVVTAVLSGRDVRAAMATLTGTVLVGVLASAFADDGVWWRLGTALWVAAVAPWVLYRIDLAVRADNAQRATQRAEAAAQKAAQADAQRRADERAERAVQRAETRATAPRNEVRNERPAPRNEGTQRGHARSDLTAQTAGQRVEWVRNALREHPDRADWTAAQWADVTGLGRRTMQNVLRAARRPELVAVAR